jgi:hypothetical protein
MPITTGTTISVAHQEFLPFPTTRSAEGLPRMLLWIACEPTALAGPNVPRQRLTSKAQLHLVALRKTVVRDTSEKNLASFVQWPLVRLAH